MKGAYVARPAVAVLALAGGAVVGVCVVALHAYWWGLLVGFLTTVALLVAIPGGWWRRLPFALGWSAAVVVLTVQRPEGDYLVEQSANGYLLLGAGVGVLLGGVVGLRHHAAPEPRD
ncbi:hypothetical protein SFC88_13240 [Nocardioides sp. HM23]|uniref:hypothetical protein n=1 Tax=Nocardioides bizhenqiangii TaxID=3095076 RepID=UPI002ACAE91C|nr:hypothetical protein [Nocardioides sp. HM23]MDZ5621804.1 hypothetical protein [Nocardioides sp. HM23]